MVRVPSPVPLRRIVAAALCVTLFACVRADSAQRTGPASADAVTRAREAVGRGRYAEAEAALTPLAQGGSGEAAFELGLLLQYVGRRAEAERWLNRAIASRSREMPDLVRAARAARALGDVRLANELFQDGADRAPEDAALNLAWGELYLDTHDPAEAAELFQMAVEAAPDSPAAYTGLARALAGDAPPPALKALERALELDREYVPAHLLRAELLLDQDHREEAVDAIARVLAINPSSLEGLALRGAVAYLEDRREDFSREVAAALAINPVYGEAYRVAGELAARHYRFEEAVALVREALRIDPDLTEAYADLGMHLLRTGEEAEARTALERAWEDDPFNQVTFNLLNMLDTLETFETVEGGSVVLRLHPEEEPFLREYVLDLAHEALDALSARYQFTPQGPILIEVFPKHDDFAVRNLGLPGMIGALGACFGRVVTMDSPQARDPIDFNWGATLWHELAHVITLQMSDNRLPRWLSEGISVYEEKVAAPEWHRESDEMDFAQRLNRDEVLPLDDLNAGFTDGRTISLAYYQSSVVVEHIVETHGHAALRALVRAYGEGLDDEGAIRQALGIDIEDLQRAFDGTVEARFASLRQALASPPGLKEGVADPETAALIANANPDNYLAQLAYGQLLWQSGRAADALPRLERAATLVPQATGPGSPRAIIAAIAIESGDTARAVEALEGLLRHDDSDVGSARRLAELLAATSDPDRARLIAAYERVVAIDPFDAAAHAALGRLLLEAGRHDEAAREFRTALASRTTDRAAVHVDLAEAYLGSRRPADARREVLAALEIAPGYERAQLLFLRLIEAE